MPIVAKAMKPIPAALFVAMHKLGAKRAETVMIGDQLSTDVLAAHNAGIAAYLLAPLVEQDLKHTQYVRMIERVILGDASPEGLSQPTCSQVENAAQTPCACEDAASCSKL